MMIEMVFLKNIIKANNLLITFPGLLDTIFWNSFLKIKLEKNSKEKNESNDCGI